MPTPLPLRNRASMLSRRLAAAAGLAGTLLSLPTWGRQEAPPPPPEQAPPPDRPSLTPPGLGEQPQVTPKLEGLPQAEDGAGAAPGAQPLGAPAPPPQAGNEAPQPPDVETGMIELNFTGEVDLMILINYVRDELGIQIILTDAGIQGKRVVLTAPVKVPQDKILQFLTFLLEQNGYTIVRNELGIYMVQPNQAIGATSALVSDPFGATQIISTPGWKPSALVQHLATALGGGAQGGGGNIVALDELGVLLITDSPRRTQLIRDLVERLVEERARVKFMRFEVKHIAASIARERILALIGAAAETGIGQLLQPQQPGKGGAQGVQAISAGGGQTSTNFSELRLDPQSNSLLFLGREADGKYIEQMLALVDVPNTLMSRWYPVGGQAAEAIAAAASREGLGEVTYQATDGTSQQLTPGLNLQQQGFQQPGRVGGAGSSGSVLQGSGFVIYPDSGGFMYHGTLTQHARIDSLVGELEPLTRGEQIVYEFYKLRYAKAEDVADIMQNLLSNQLPSGNTGTILGQDLGRGADRRRNRRTNRADQAATQPPGAVQPAGDGLGAIESDDSFVLADEKNNQIVVKAVQRLQPQFEQLIGRLDLRRPQVFINAKIIAVTDSMNFRMAVETQIMAGQFHLNTNFGLSSFGTAPFTDAKTVNTGLQGLTSALIKSDYVPFILTALQNNTDARILATPQLLVDANEEAEISSVNVVPTSVSSQSNSTTITSQGQDATAGTTLIVTPQISESSVKLDLDITQSSFTGSPSAPGLAPPSLENHLSSASVTVPPDATVVIGGLTLESVQNTIIKVPLLGDIPLIGQMFRDTNKSKQRATLYIFITPTIMRDPTFADLRLLTRGPMDQVRYDPEDRVPLPEPVRARILEPVPFRIEGGPDGTLKP